MNTIQAGELRATALGRRARRLENRRAGAELALGTLRTEHRQVVVDVEISAPLVEWVLVVARLPGALGASGFGMSRG
jgi:hypothetical protein